MSATTQRSESTTASGDTQRPGSTIASAASAAAASRHRGPLVVGLLGALTLVTVAAVVAGNRPDATAATAHQDLSAYSRGGSVYTEQVPTGAASWTVAYAPGGAVYQEQVPSGPTVADLSAYAAGGSVYTEQVPGFPSS